MVTIQHKNGSVRITNDGVIRAMIGRTFIPGSFANVQLARVAIAHHGYRTRPLGMWKNS